MICTAPDDCYCDSCDPPLYRDPALYVVTGGRAFDDPSLIARALDAITEPGDTIVEGGATGADTLARQWALANGRKVLTVRAEWKLGRSAGPMRNRKMLTLPYVRACVAFPGGAGTANCKRQARGLDIFVFDVTADWQPSVIA